MEGDGEGGEREREDRGKEGGGGRKEGVRWMKGKGSALRQDSFLFLLPVLLCWGHCHWRPDQEYTWPEGNGM